MKNQYIQIYKKNFKFKKNKLSYNMKESTDYTKYTKKIKYSLNKNEV